MSTLASIGIKKEKLLDLMNSTQGEWLNLTIDVKDDIDKFGNNVSIYEQQTKEERDAKASKNYLGNGKVFWTDGKVTAAPKKSSVPF